VQLIERGPGQREERYAQLLGGPVQTTAPALPLSGGASAPRPDLEERVEALERQVAELTERLKALSGD
jgi:uncharacterized protein YceH (UPF0502 family)